MLQEIQIENKQLKENLSKLELYISNEKRNAQNSEHQVLGTNISPALRGLNNLKIEIKENDITIDKKNWYWRNKCSLLW